jgi:hypothetical protein
MTSHPELFSGNDCDTGSLSRSLLISALERDSSNFLVINGEFSLLDFIVFRVGNETIPP